MAANSAESGLCVIFFATYTTTFKLASDYCERWWNVRLLHEAVFNTDWIEKRLAHEQRGVRAIYNKAEYAKQRRMMLQAWADTLDRWIKEGPRASFILPGTEGIAESDKVRRSNTQC